MQPVPVQRSRTRISEGRFCAFRRRPARCVIEAAVSALFVSSVVNLSEASASSTSGSRHQAYNVFPSRQNILYPKGTAVASQLLYL
jgi:hypothetical protein